MTAEFAYQHTTPENMRNAADTAAEAIRYMNHATISADSGGLEDPSDVDAVLASMETLTERVPQLLDQLAAWLVHECKAQRVRVTDAPDVHSPSVEARAVAMVRRYLDEAGAEVVHGAASLHDARQITAQLAGVPGEEEGERADG